MRNLSKQETCTKVRLTTALVGATLMGCIVFLAPAQSHATSTPLHIAEAYGASVTVGTKASLGPIAVAQLPACSTQPTGNFTATAGSANLSPLVDTGVINTASSNTTTSSTATANVTGISLLGGLIRADALEAVSTSGLSSQGAYYQNATGSKFTNLSILGLPVSVSPAPNTTIDLPGIGYVVLNEQTALTASNESKLTVNMVHVYVNITNHLYKLGTQIIISSASSEFKLVGGPALVGGYAYSPFAVLGPVQSGPLVYELIPCQGTGGVTDTDSVTSLSVPGVATTGTVVATGMSNINKSEAISKATTSVAGVSLLSGLVSATAVQGVATGTTTDGVNFDFTGGSTFVGIYVAGHPEITADIAPNTKISIAGLGTLYLNRVLNYSNEIRVFPIELVVNATNSLGLPIGADIKIGAAEAQLHSATIP